jgi:hypothetical protein
VFPRIAIKGLHGSLKYVLKIAGRVIKGDSGQPSFKSTRKKSNIFLKLAEAP